jgi:hypothetical protein
MSGRESGSCVSRQIQSRQFTSHEIRVDLRRVESTNLAIGQQSCPAIGRQSCPSLVLLTI